MTVAPRYSRPVRFAAQLGGIPDERMADHFRHARVAIRLEPAFQANGDARETFTLAVNMVLRFCSRVTVILPVEEHHLRRLCRELASAMFGIPRALQIQSEEPNWDGFDAILNIGRERRADVPWITVNSTGWLARVAPAGTGDLYWARAPYNPLGSLAAACFGVSQVFMLLVQRPTAAAAIETSLFTHEVAQPGILDSGPDLPDQPLRIAGVLIGCGGVSNGWGYTVRRMPIVGVMQAVDRQAVRDENLGPYVAAFPRDVTIPKAVVMKALLGPKIEVLPRPEEFELFKIRLDLGLVPIPPLAVAGLDNVATRHSLQRLWPNTVIDMASGGTATQTIVKTATREGICLLEALKMPAGESQYADDLAIRTGLSAERIRNSPTEPINDDDVRTAPERFRAGLQNAKLRGQLICGRLTDCNLREEEYEEDFTPAVPFVTAFSGVVGAAETMKQLMGCARPVHHQFDFGSMRARALQLRCDDKCECQGHVRV